MECAAHLNMGQNRLDLLNYKAMLLLCCTQQQKFDKHLT